ncbi:MAG: leucine-rich repeat domain-containing protein [Clostridia bacterium]|nr:leucine-rich repeat domain-containing protein [Clostridia bacterium]
MKKRLFTYSLILILGVLLFSSCGNSQDTDTDILLNTETSSDTATEIVDSTTDTETETEAETDTETMVNIETDTSTDLATDTNTDTGTEIEPPHEHTIGFVEAKAPTCTTAGLTEGRVCSTCGEVILEPKIIPAIGHTVVLIPAVEPGCMEYGLTVGAKCSGCGEIYVKQEKVEPIGHNWEVVPEIEATCTQLGLTEGKRCSSCHQWAIEQEVIPKADHNYIIHMPKEPTCTEKGHKAYQSCASCWYKEYYEPIPALGHKYNGDYICIQCGDELIPTQELVFSLIPGEDAYMVTGIKTDTVAYLSSIVVPKTYNGLPVTAILMDSFSNISHSDVTLTIPNTITYINNSIFSFRTYNCNINFLGTVEEWCNIEIYTPVTMYSKYSLYFNGEKVTKIVIPDTVTEINSYQFSHIDSIKSVVIPEGVTSIGANAFAKSSISSITLPSTLKTIGANAFAETKISNITLPSSLESVGEGAFSYCYSLNDVNYLGDIKGWCDIDFATISANPISRAGCLSLNGEKLTELVIPSTVKEIKNYQFYNLNSITSITIQEGVSTIGDYAFAYSSSANKLIISEGLESIGKYAFQLCSSLDEVTMPKTINAIHSGAFYGSNNVSTLNYLGNVSDWCNIDFEWYDATPVKKSTTVYFNGEEATSIVIPSTVSEINDYQFYNFANLVSVTFPKELTRVGMRAFYGCTSIKKVSYLGDVEGWCNIDFEALSLFSKGTQLYFNGELVTDIVIPSTVGEIKKNAFIGYELLEKVVIEDGITAIGISAFQGCTGIKEIELPSTLKTIGDYALQNCIGLKILVLPSGVESIGNQSFSGCFLSSVVIPNTVTSIGSYAFNKCYWLRIFCESTEQPKEWNTNWNYTECPVFWYSEEEPTDNGEYWRYVDGNACVWP